MRAIRSDWPVWTRRWPRRRNAHDALKAENFTARIDGFLEVNVAARLFL
jgi:hypothetical protein